MVLKKIPSKKRKIQLNNLEPVVIDFGNRKVSQQNFSKIVALPKMALQLCGDNISQVNVKLVQFRGEKLIQLTPIENKEVKLSE